jgi:hypothetical protein
MADKNYNETENPELKANNWSGKSSAMRNKLKNGAVKEKCKRLCGR